MNVSRNLIEGPNRIILINSEINNMPSLEQVTNIFTTNVKPTHNYTDILNALFNLKISSNIDPSNNNIGKLPEE